MCVEALGGTLTLFVDYRSNESNYIVQQPGLELSRNFADYYQ